MHTPIRNAVLILGTGAVALVSGFVLVLAMLTEAFFKPTVGGVVAGLALMLMGVGFILFGLVRLALRKPSAAELAGSSKDEPRGWHFTRFGVGYLFVMLFGFPAMMMLAPEPQWPVLMLVGLGYTVFALGFLVPALRRVFFYAPQDQPAPAPDVQPQTVVDYYGPLVAVAFVGLAALGAVLALSADDAATQRRGLSGVVMGVVGFAVSIVPAWRRRLLRPKKWRG